MKQKVELKVQPSRVLVAVWHPAWGEFTYVCPGESFHDVEYAVLVALGDGTHELEYDPRRAHRRRRGKGPVPVFSVEEELGWLEFGWEEGLHTTNELCLKLLSLCAERGAGQVVPSLPESLRTPLGDFVRGIPVEAEGGFFLFYPEITRELILEARDLLDGPPSRQ